MFVSLKLKLLKWVKIVKRLRIKFCVWSKKACVQQFSPCFKMKKNFYILLRHHHHFYWSKCVPNNFFWKIKLFIQGDKKLYLTNKNKGNLHDDSDKKVHQVSLSWIWNLLTRHNIQNRVPVGIVRKKVLYVM